MRVRPKYDPIDVAQIREKLSMTQEEFSEHYCVPLATLRGWEQGKRYPDRGSRALLRLVQAIPTRVREVLKETPP